MERPKEARQKYFSALQPAVRPKRGMKSILAVFVLTLLPSVTLLAVWPIPVPLVLAFAIVGLCTGALALLDEEFFAWAALAVFLLGLTGVTAYGERKWQGLHMLTWQSGLLTLCVASATILFGTSITRRIAKKTGPPDEQSKLVR